MISPEIVPRPPKKKADTQQKLERQKNIEPFEEVDFEAPDLCATSNVTLTAFNIKDSGRFFAKIVCIQLPDWFLAHTGRAFPPIGKHYNLQGPQITTSARVAITWATSPHSRVPALFRGARYGQQ